MTCETTVVVEFVPGTETYTVVGDWVVTASFVLVMTEVITIVVGILRSWVTTTWLSVVKVAVLTLVSVRPLTDSVTVFVYVTGRVVSSVWVWLLVTVI